MNFGICICTQMGKHKCHMQNDLGCRLAYFTNHKCDNIQKKEKIQILYKTIRQSTNKTK